MKETHNTTCKDIYEYIQLHKTDAKLPFNTVQFLLSSLPLLNDSNENEYVFSEKYIFTKDTYQRYQTL